MGTASGLRVRCQESLAMNGKAFKTPGISRGARESAALEEDVHLETGHVQVPYESPGGSLYHLAPCSSLESVYC